MLHTVMPESLLVHKFCSSTYNSSFLLKTIYSTNEINLLFKFECQDNIIYENDTLTHINSN